MTDDIDTSHEPDRNHWGDILTPPDDTQAPPDLVRSLPMRYRNYRGEVATRGITPISLWWGSTEWHPEAQWLLTAWDWDKDAKRDFALKDCDFASLELRVAGRDMASPGGDYSPRRAAPDPINSLCLKCGAPMRYHHAPVFAAKVPDYRTRDEQDIIGEMVREARDHGGKWMRCTDLLNQNFTVLEAWTTQPYCEGPEPAPDTVRTWQSPAAVERDDSVPTDDEIEDFLTKARELNAAGITDAERGNALKETELRTIEQSTIEQSAYAAVVPDWAYETDAERIAKRPPHWVKRTGTAVVRLFRRRRNPD